MYFFQLQENYWFPVRYRQSIQPNKRCSVSWPFQNMFCAIRTKLKSSWIKNCCKSSKIPDIKKVEFNMVKSLMHWLRPYSRQSEKVESTPSTCFSTVLKSSSHTSSSSSSGGITLHKITDIDDPADKNHFILTGMADLLPLW